MATPESHKLRWFAFYAQPSAEKRAGESIRDLGFPVFVPFEKRIRRRPNRKPQHYETALFPRYGFVQFAMTDEWGPIKSADGVSDLVCTNWTPRPIPDHVIDALKLADSMGLLDRTQPHKVGQNVELTEGPFAGFIGKILRARSGDRVDILLDMFGSAVSATAPIATLKEA